MGKAHLTLGIEAELIQLAKASGINLSEEFTQYLKSRLQVLAISEINKLEELDRMLVEAKSRLASIEAEKKAEEEKQKFIKNKERQDYIEKVLK